MKHILLILLSIIVITCAHAQTYNGTKDTTSVNDEYASAQVDTFNIAKTVAGAISTIFQTRFVTIENQSTTATDSLWVWFDNDSTKFKFVLLPGRIWNKNTLLKSINTRSGSKLVGSGTVKRQITVKSQ